MSGICEINKSIRLKCRKNTAQIAQKIQRSDDEKKRMKIMLMEMKQKTSRFQLQKT